MPEEIYPDDREVHCRQEEFPGETAAGKIEGDIPLSPARNELSGWASQARSRWC